MTVSVPILNSVGDVYELHWVEEGIYITLDHVSEGENMNGEFHVELNGTENKRSHVYQAKMNLLSISAKKSLAEALRKRRDDFEWETIIEQACYKTIEAFRRGDPTTVIGYLPQRTKPRYRMYPFVLEENMSSLFGNGGSGKSYVACFIAVSVQTGMPFLGYSPIQGNVLILDWEATQEDWDEMIKAVSAGFGIDPPLIFYKHCYHTLPDDIIEIQKVVMQEDIQLVIIDSVGMASELVGEYHSSAIKMLRAARSLGCSILLLDHKTKEGKQFGSIYKINEVRSAFELKSAKDSTGKLLDISIKNTKINNGAFAKTQALRIEFTGDDNTTEIARFSTINLNESEELSKDEPVWSRISYVLRGGPLTIDQISDELSVEKANITTNLNRHKKHFLKLNDGRWGLKDLNHPENLLL